MKKSFLILLLIVPALQSHSQNAALFNRSLAFSHETEIADIVSSPDGGWLFCGHDHPCDRALMGQVDSEGNVTYFFLIIPDYLYSEALSNTFADDSSYVVAGLCRFSDDVGIDRGFVTKISGGNQLWTKVFDPVFNDVRVKPDSEILLFGSPEIFILNPAGDSIGSISTSLFKHDEILSDNNILLANDFQVFIIDSAGTQLEISSFSNVLAIATAGVDRIAVLADNTLQLFDYNLNLIASSATLGNFVQGSLLSDSTGFWIEAKDINSNGSLLHLSDSLTLIYDVDLPVSNNDYSRNFFGLAKNDTMIVAIGNESYLTSSCSALKTFKSSSGETSALTTDATLLSDTWDLPYYIVDTITSSFFITFYHFEYHIQIQNSGTDTIHTITINGNLPGGINCLPQFVFLSLANLALAPNETFEYSFPVIMTVTGPLSPMPINYNACVWLSSPNNNLDANLSDNYSCSIVTAVEPVNDKPAVSMFPNPASDEVQLKLPPGASFILEINDAAGHIFYKEFVKENATLNVRNYPAGYYIVTLSGKNEKVFRSLIIQ